MGLFKKKGETTPSKPLEVKPPKSKSKKAPKSPREDVNMGYQSDQASPAHSEEQAIAMQTFSTNVSAYRNRCVGIYVVFSMCVCM